MPNDDIELTDLFPVKRPEQATEPDSVELAESIVLPERMPQETENSTQQPNTEIAFQYKRGNIKSLSNGFVYDFFIYRLVVGTLSGAIALCLIGGMILAFLRLPIPDFIIVTGSNAIGAIGGLLAPAPQRRDRHEDE